NEARHGNMLHPLQRYLAKGAGARGKGLSGAMAQMLLESLGGGWETEDGFIVKANEMLIEQLANSILIANSFEGHAGRPGIRGGSAPSGESFNQITERLKKECGTNDL